MKYAIEYLMVLLLAVGTVFGVELDNTKVYVPYGDLARVIDSADKAILMDTAGFEALLAAAIANSQDAPDRQIAQIVRAEYTAAVSGMNVTLTGTLEVVSLSDEPVAVPLGFGAIGLTELSLGQKAAPLGYDANGRLTLVLTEKGTHQLKIAGTVRLNELAQGGTGFGLTVPEAVAGQLKLMLAGDMEVHATVPVVASNYDKAKDTTEVDLAIGGKSALTVVLLGNGRQDDERAILLGEAATSVQLTRNEQAMSCMYTVQVLRRGVRELRFALPAEWTVTEVTCVRLLKWSVEPVDNKTQELAVRLRSAKTGTTALHIKALAKSAEGIWHGPKINLADAAFERGYMLVSADEGVRVRSERLIDAQREAISATASIAGLQGLTAGQLYFHWGNAWQIDLEPAVVELYRTIKAKQHIEVLTEQVRLTGEFEITAVDREMFDMSFAITDTKMAWNVETVSVDGKEEGFEYRVETNANGKLLEIELPRPVMPEKAANVKIVLRHVPADWQWNDTASTQRVAVPLIEPQGRNVSGHVSVEAAQDLDMDKPKVDDTLDIVPVGRMASLGLSEKVRYAWRHKTAARGYVSMNVSRRTARIAAQGQGLITVRPQGMAGHWRIVYTISRASARKLYLLADRSLLTDINITSPTVRFSAKHIVEPGPDTIEIAEPIANRCNLWVLEMDDNRMGDVVVDIQYEKPLEDGGSDTPLVRPICNGHIAEQLAIQAGEDLAVDIQTHGAREMDAVDLDGLPVSADRILAAYRLDPVTAEDTGDVEIRLATKVHAHYAIPSALVTSAQLITHVDVTGAQRTEAVFHIANAGMQFLTMRLPAKAQLWSLRVGDTQAKPQRSASGDYQVMLQRSQQPVPVRVVYAYEPLKADLEHLPLAGIELTGVEINRMQWRVVSPPGYKVVSQDTKMEEAGRTGPQPAFLDTWHLLSKMGGIFFLPKQMMISTIDGLDTRGGRLLYEKAAMVAIDEAQITEMERVAPANKPVEQKAKVKAEMLQETAIGKRVTARGRYTLPVHLIAAVGAGGQASFTSLGQSGLTVGMKQFRRLTSWWMVGFLLMLAAGVAMTMSKVRIKVYFVTVVLVVSSLAAVWIPTSVYFANGVFAAAASLIGFYIVAGFIRWLLCRLHLVNIETPYPRTIAAVMLCTAVVISGSAKAAQATEITPKPALPSIIVPYHGDASKAPDAGKVLVPYSRFVELWNQAHPDDPLDKPRPDSDISLSDVQYDATLAGRQFDIVLRAQVVTYGSEWVTIAMPFEDVAVTEATFNGKEAKLQRGPRTMMLMLPGGAKGLLEIRAVTTPMQLGKRGSVQFSVPPLPGAVMHVTLADTAVELEADSIDGIAIRKDDAAGSEWIVPLSMRRNVALRWQPKAPQTAADTTLSAVVDHNVYAFHWAIVGVTKVEYTFSAGEHDRFYLLTPQDVMLTELKGTNLKDVRQVGDKTIDGGTFKVLEVNLHRPAKQKYEMTVRWLGHVDGFDAPSRLWLVRADGVGRESGSVTLHTAGGMTMKVAKVEGGRRTAISDVQTTESGKLSSDRAIALTKYYWPYRPFAMHVQYGRPAVSPVISLDQLVRVNRDKVELLVEAALKSEAANVFGAVFGLPKGYELLSVVGASVENYYERSDDQGRRLYVKFKSAEKQTKMAMVLMANQFDLEDFEVPLISYLDDGALVAKSKVGRVAVQVVSSLNAQTKSSSNLKAVVPGVFAGWLDNEQLRAVQFGYRYEDSEPALRLRIRPQLSRVRLETFAAMNMRPTASMYTYRLRYRISGSPIDRLTFGIEDRYSALSVVESPAMRSVTKRQSKDGNTMWDLSLVNEVTGTVDVTLNFSLPVDASTTALEMPRLRTEGVDEVQTIIAVQNMSRHEMALTDWDKLAALPLSEQQKLMPAAMQSSLQYVYQTFEREWSFRLGFKPAQPASRIQAVVDLLAIKTVIDRKGRSSYEVNVELQNRSEQFLRVKAPTGLKLWSAQVAGQAVKPVVDSEAATGQIMIPLVKTSPGGLPYDVKMYFAGEAVQPLDGVSTLRPPAISIVDIEVLQTTWSVWLPKGYRYVRPGGNVSAIAGTAEVMSLGIETTLRQLQRLDKTYREIAGTSSKGEQFARYNIEMLNKKAAEEMQMYQEYLQRNPDRVDGDEYSRLQESFSQQKAFQNRIIAGNTMYVQRQDAQILNDVNGYLNSSSDNFGTADGVRNKALLAKPEFVGANELRQIERLNEELDISQKQRQVLATDQLALQAGDDYARTAIDGETAAGLILQNQDDTKESLLILNSVITSNTAQAERDISQVQKQLEGLKDNRALRHFKGQEVQQQLQAQRPTSRSSSSRGRITSPPQDQPQRPAQPSNARGAERKSRLGSYFYDSDTDAGISRAAGRTMEYGMGGGMMGGISGDMGGLGITNSAAVQAGQQVAGFDAYVAGGTYSLPVSLPTDGVRLDFARPGGDAQLSIVAIPVGMIRNAKSTAIIAILAAITVVIIKFWPTGFQPATMKTGYVIIYLAVLTALTIIAGIFGLIAAAAFIALCEHKRARRAMGTACK